jgi:hypothetical protein
MKKKQEKISARQMTLHRDLILQGISGNHNQKVVESVALQIEKFVMKSFPNTPQGTVVLAMQFVTDKIMIGMLEIQ